MSDGTTTFETGAVRSSDKEHLDFTSIPLIGLIGVARTAHEGGTKYGRYNYMLGMPAHACVNHAIGHLVMWLLGDRTEPHLSHAAWNCMAADQGAILNPEINEEHLLGPGATVTYPVRFRLEEGKPDRDEARANGEFADLGRWVLEMLPEVQTILRQRNPERYEEEDGE